ncbi:hypothetical protein K466DRAFT_600758 [Polyporus arcularius HHB13444]|uniref:Ferritin-like domain-containing protein n=1 Tax=Polyporus arcularius HHB13444 TaxID=1314778 RepID=A0A5C3P891_9APHY|nr:hypothetical protein K466DRAFT_600758 [Polyporus arcularius HHB13444]
MLKEFLLAFAAVTSVRSAPATRMGLIGVTDTDVLQYALFLEQLESAFYRGALDQFDEAAFAAAGYPPSVREGFVQISEQELEHVNFLSTALGSDARQPCVYDFAIPHLSVYTFILAAPILENLGASAYIGAAHLIKDPSYLTSAASILSVEARHASWVCVTAAGCNPYPQAFDPPLPTSEVVVKALAYITSCPQLPPVLPDVNDNNEPGLTLSDHSPAPGARVNARFTPASGRSTVDRPAYVAWMNGSGVEYSEIRRNGETTVPQGLNGTVYAVAVSSRPGDAARMPSVESLLSGVVVARVS